MQRKEQLKQYLVLPVWRQSLGGSLFLLLAFGVFAQEAKTLEVQKPVEQSVRLPQPKIGEATHKLLELQGRGALASERQHPMPAAVAEKIYQRYVNSFTHPIPEKLGSTLETQK